ncbi:MAG: FG-GAP-like repeat-containing protein, partial [Candidatus Hydrogenedentes bacterium]|nr:FG-GAP-like repeat-containing protein [Candidatus Hydrogenedentota bacterium]
GRGGLSAPVPLTDPMTGKTCGFVACELDTGVVCFDVNGNKWWEYAMVPPVTAAPAVADVNGDGRLEVIAADSKGNLVVLSSEGKPVWTAHVPGGVVADSCPAAVDLQGDGALEILVGDVSGTLTCLDGAGKLEWRFSGDGSQMGPVLCADIYDVPGKEIIVTSHDRHVYALTANGEWLWDLYRANDLFPISVPVLADVDGDNIPELYIGGGLNHFYRIDLVAHRIVLDENVMMHVNGAIAASDLDGDGKDEVVFGNKGDSLWCYANDGFRWKREFRGGAILAAPTLVNLDDDPALEMLVYANNGIEAIDTDGAIMASLQGPCSVGATPLAGDLDGGGMLEVLTTSSGGNALIALLKSNVPFREDPRNRLMLGSDPAHTGRVRGAKQFPLLPAPAKSQTTGKAVVTSANPLLLLSGLNTWRFDVDNPESRRLMLSVELTAPDGTAQRFVRHLSSAKERTQVSFDADAVGTYDLRRTVIDADRLEVLSEQQDTLAFNGFGSDRSFLESEVFPAIVNACRKWADTNPRCAKSMLAQLTTLRGTLDGLAKDDVSDRVEALAALRDSALRIRALAEAGVALAPKDSFVAWRFNPWAYFDSRATLPAATDRAEAIETSLCVGGYDSAAVNVTNMIDRSMEVRVRVEDVPGSDPLPAARHVEIRRAVTVPTIRRTEVADALPLLDQGGLVRIAPLESQQIWITLDAVGLKPGEYKAMLKVKSIEPDPAEVVIPIGLRVYGLELPRPRPLRFCLWSFDGGDLGTDKPEVLRDLTSHGVSVFFGTPPKAVCTTDGALACDIDFTAHDESVTRLKPYGFLLFMSPQSMVTGQPFLSEPWKKAFVLYLRTWAAHLKNMGVDYKDWALYPYDEPSTPYAETTLNLVEVAKLIREADPRILIYADPTSGATMETVKMFTGLIDIWCPSTELLERLGPELVPAAKQAGKEVWFYDAAGEARTLSCLGIYRWRFWHAWTQGFSGAGWWTYQINSGADRWDGPNPTGDFFATVYDGLGGVVSSKRWEVAREGVEDYELLYLLRERIRAAEKANAPETELAAARKTLEETPRKVEATLLDVGRRLPLTPDSVPLYEEATCVVNEAREAIIKSCLALGPMRETIGETDATHDKERLSPP